MRLVNLALIMAIPLALNVGCSESGSDGGTGGTGGAISPEPYAGNICVGAKQAAAATYCQTVFDAWAAWEADQDNDARDAATQAAGVALGGSWDVAESDAEGDSANCSDLALTSSDASSDMEANISDIVDSINDGLNLGQSDEATCGAALLTASGVACNDVLTAEGAYIADLYADLDGSTLDAAISAASDAFSAAWTAAGDCPTTAIDTAVRDAVQSLSDELVQDTIVTPMLSDAEYSPVTPGQTEYLGRTYDPQCMQGDDYRFYGRRGSVNKLLMYYMGGGACWDNLTCGGTMLTDFRPVCSDSTPDPDVLNGDRAGFGDLTNPNNPFSDWNIVFVSYCSCDVHFGDVTQPYGDVTVEHKGYHNAKVAEKWAREHFLNPEEVFVTGTSAGAYGAWFNAPLLHEVWPASQIHVLADAGNGVITDDFLQNEFGNWEFVTNLPDIPGVLEAINPEGGGMPAYTEAVAIHFPDTNWAHYATRYDGGGGGQTGFYNIMLKGTPLAQLSWWEASCAFGDVVLTQSEDTYAVVPDNYRYYFGTGSRHGMFNLDKVYGDTTGGVPTIVDWVDAMLASGPDGRDDAWTNVLCENCGLLLDGDPRPPEPDPPGPLPLPFVEQGEDVVIDCPPPE